MGARTRGTRGSLATGPRGVAVFGLRPLPRVLRGSRGNGNYPHWVTHPDGSFAELNVPLITGPCVYRFWDADDRPLYVGRCSWQQLLRRVGGHMRDAHHRTEWWKDVARIDFAELPDDDAANVLERRQIYLLRPVHNKVFNCGHDCSLPENYEPGGRRCLACLREHTEKQAAARKATRGANKTARRARTAARLLARGTDWEEAGRQPEWDESRRQRDERRAAIVAFVAERRETMTGAELARLIAERFGGQPRSHQARLYEGAYGPKAQAEHAAEDVSATG
jgi:hypothetical protein